MWDDNALVMSPRATPAPAPPLAYIDPSSMEIDVQPPVYVSHVTGTCPIPTETAPPPTDDGAYPAPDGTVPPSAEQISSFLQHARHQATDGVTATAVSTADAPGIASDGVAHSTVVVHRGKTGNPRQRNRKRSRPHSARDHSRMVVQIFAAHEESSAPMPESGLSDGDGAGP